jgi:GntR family transcriptional repressor for pyruvate dehydrogenase complex
MDKILRKANHMMSFKPIRQVRIYEEVLKQLREAILSGHYRSGEKLPSERELSEQFQVSRVVIREAIRVLELRGFVTLRQGPSGGAFVVELSLHQLSNAFQDLFLSNKLSAKELVQVRRHIEPEITRLAALRVSKAARNKLEQAYKAEHAETLTHSEWVARNLKIHYLLAEMCGNRFFEAILSPLLDLTREMVLVVKPDQTVIHDHKEHEAIVEAVAAKDPEAASLAMVKHISQVGASLIELEAQYRKKKGLLAYPA